MAGGAAHQLWLGLAAWRWMFISAALPALVYGLLPMRLLESPRYLVDLIGAGAALGALPDRARRITRRVTRTVCRRSFLTTVRRLASP